MPQLYTQERWLPIQGFEGLYEVSSHGRVKSVQRIIPVEGHPTIKAKTVKERILAQKLNRPTGHGYVRKLVILYKCNSGLTINVARLVADAFLENPENADYVLHLDDDATNNHVSNLEWGDRAENVRQAVERNRYRAGDAHHASKMTCKEREQAYELLQKKETVNSVAKRFNVSHQTISDLRAGKVKGFSMLPSSRAKRTVHPSLG